MKAVLLYTTNRAMRFINSTCLMMVLLGSGFSGEAQTWGQQSSSITDNINGLTFSKSVNTGFAVASGGRILKTTSSGNAWVLQNSGTVNNLYAVCFSNNIIDTGYIVGDSGLVLMTINGGSNWTKLTSGTTQRLNDISLYNGTGFIVGDSGIILRISGTTITSLNSNTTNNLYSVHKFNNTSALVAGGGILSATLLATYNSGNVWTPITTGASGGINDVFVVNDSTAVIVGNAGTVMKSTNYGTTWSTQVSGSFSNLNAVYFVSVDSGYIAGGAGTLLHTTNGGTTWSASVSGTTSALNDVTFTDAYRGYAAGNGGTIIRTCPTVRFDISPNDSVCIHSTVDFTNQSKNSNTYIWLKNGDTVSTSTDYSYDFDSAGSYTVRLIADNGTCTNSLTQIARVEEAPEVDLGPDTTICSTCTITLDAGNPGSTYTWYRNGIATGVVSRTNTVGVAGTYRVKVENAYGCIADDSVKVSLSTGLATLAQSIESVNVYPNPNNRLFTLDFTIPHKQTTTISVTNLLGEIVYEKYLADFSGMYSGSISLGSFSPGIYMINIHSGDQNSITKVVTY